MDAVIIGYLSVSASSIRIDDLSSELSKKLPKYPLPILRLTRLAIDVKYKNIGMGKQLLKFALELSVKQKAFGFESVNIVSGTLDIRPYATKYVLSYKSDRKKFVSQGCCEDKTPLKNYL